MDKGLVVERLLQATIRALSRVGERGEFVSARWRFHLEDLVELYNLAILLGSPDANSEVAGWKREVKALTEELGRHADKDFTESSSKDTEIIAELEED